MKAKLVKFYVNKVEPKLKSARAKLTQFKLWLTGRLAAAKAKVSEAKQQGRAWLARHKRSLWVTVIVAAALVATALLVYLWQGSPAFRAAAKGVTALVTGCLAGLWALLRGSRPTEIPVPVVVTEQPQPSVGEAAFPVQYSPDDGRF
jgi:hypothetical protein